MLPTLRWIILILATGPIVYGLMSMYAVVSYFRKLRKMPPRRDVFSPPVSILKPVRGADNGAYENFASYCQLDYPEYELVFAVADAEDPAVPLIEKLQIDFPGCAIRLLKGVERLGANNKVNNLARLVREAKYHLLVMTDSDVRVDSDYLREVVAPFANAEVGGVTTFYRCLGGGTIASSLSQLGMCMDSAPSALVARMLEGKMQFAYGWTMATTKKNLEEIGGWEAMANHHSDDFELGNRIAGRGYRVELMRKPVGMVFARESMAQYFRHELRWSIGLRNVRPLAYGGMIFTHGLPWAVAAAIVAFGAGRPSVAVAYLAAYLVLRVAGAWATGVWGLRDSRIARKLWLVPVRDAVSFCVWVMGFFSDTIEWRGLVYRVKRRLLIPVPADKQQH